MSKGILASPKQDGHTDHLPAAEELDELSHLHRHWSGEFRT